MVTNSDEMGITTFYNEQSSFIRYISKRNVRIIDRDMNAQITEARNNKYHKTNRNNEYSTDFSFENWLARPNNTLEKRRRKTVNQQL